MKHIKNQKWIFGDSYKKKVLLENLEEKINLIEDVIVKPHGIIPVHKHDFTDEIFYITENSAIMIVNGKEFKVHLNDMVYVDRNEEHGFRNESDKEFKMIVFKINFQKGDSLLR